MSNQPQRPHAALQALAVAAERAPGAAERAAALRALGDWFLGAGLTSDAVGQYTSALHLRPDDIATSRLLVEVHAAAMDWGAAAVEARALIGRLGGAPPAARADAAIAFGMAVHGHAACLTQHSRDLEAAGELEECAQVMVRTLAEVPPESLSDADRWGFLTVLAIVIDAGKAARLARALDALGQYLLDNDESAKVLDLLRAVPHTLADHPRVAALSMRVEHLRTHLSNPEAYARAYSGPSLPSHQQWLAVEDAPRALRRVEWAVELIRAHGAGASVLEVGCYDGISGLRIAASCPGIRYVGTDLGEEVLARFRAQLKGHGVQLRTDVPKERFDFVLWFEVIEHVPDPVTELRRLAANLAPGGQLLVSTPWGSYDRGHPPVMTDLGTERGICGHVRAMTPRDLLAAGEAAALHCTELFGDDPAYQRGRTMQASFVPLVRPPQRRQVTFVAPGSLWPWNGRSIARDGGGGSEEMVALVAAGLAAERAVAVYGCTEEPTVHRGVAWWPSSQGWRVAGEQPATIVVPRLPLWVREAGPAPGTRRVCWLTEPHYPELNDEVASGWDRTVVVSEWQKAELSARHGVRSERMTVIPNGLDTEQFAGPSPPRVRHRFVWASSPDRGLLRLLHLWPRIRERLPDATLEFYNGWRAIEVLARHSEGWRARHRQLRLQYEVLRFQPGVIDRGMVAPITLARALREASVWLYPTDVAETFCIIAIKARAAGCIPVTSALGALPQTAAGGILLPPPVGEVDELYAQAFVDSAVTSVAASDIERLRMSEEAMATYDIRGVVRQWAALLDT